MAAIHELSNDSHLRPRVTDAERAEADHCWREALSVLQGLIVSLGSFVERVLLPLHPLVNRDAVRAFALETAREVDEVVACRRVGDMYVEDFTLTKLEDGSLSLEVEGALGVYEGQAETVCMNKGVHKYGPFFFTAILAVAVPARF